MAEHDRAWDGLSSVRRRWHNEDRAVLFESMVNDPPEYKIGDGYRRAQPNVACAAIDRLLNVATPYYWSKEMTEMLVTISDDLPDWTLSEEYLPTWDGFMWFDQPIPMPMMSEEEEGISASERRRRRTWRATTRLVGIAWTTIELIMSHGVTESVFDPHHQYTPSPGDVKRNVVMFCPIVYPMGEAHLCSITFWNVGQAYNDFEKDKPSEGWNDPDVDWAERLYRIFATALLLMKQKILRTDVCHLDKQAQKRAEREKLERVPEVRVIRLRREARPKRDDQPDSEPVEWSCRWVVSGHWREQPYGPGKELRRPVYVLPYVKGPTDKPLRPQAKRIFAVTR